MNFSQYKDQFEGYLQQHLPKILPRELYEPYQYILSLDGKRIRPVLMMAAHEAYAPLTNNVLHTAMAIELFHNFSLMHDDIMDRSDTRRGYPTVHIKYGENAAILSGDAMLILSYRLLEALHDSPHFFTIFQFYNKVAVEICIGQQYDMNFEKEVIVTEFEYLMMIEHKTAVLIATSLQMGATLGGASVEESKKMYEYGLNVGMAFQLQDDLLDSFGDAQSTGKVVGGDICNNKKTLLLIYALQNAHKTHKELLYNWLQTKEWNDTKVEDIKKIYLDSKAYDYAVNKRNTYLDQAIKALNETNISEDYKKVLTDFATKATDRIK